MRTFTLRARAADSVEAWRSITSADAVVGLCARRGEVLAALASEIEARGARPLVYAVDLVDTAARAKSAADFVDRAGGDAST
jgi:NADP-dependent 3-hydroxy acid dehydrogenase YdfG